MHVFGYTFVLLIGQVISQVFVSGLYDVSTINLLRYTPDIISVSNALRKNLTPFNEIKFTFPPYWVSFRVSEIFSYDDFSHALVECQGDSAHLEGSIAAEPNIDLWVLMYADDSDRTVEFLVDLG